SYLLGLCVLLGGLCACTDAPSLVGNVYETVDPPPVTEVVPDEPPLIPREDIVLTKGEAAIAAGNNAFAFDLLRTVAKGEEAGTNLLVSPLSASLALAMLNNGANDATQEEIQQALGYGDATREDMNSYFRKIVTAMREIDTRATFESANSIWIANNFPVLAPFRELNQTYYDAEVGNVDFTDAATCGLINDWCKEKTHGLIPELLDGLDPATLMCLVNALYFKASWSNHFEKSLTQKAPFHNQSGKVATVDMMKGWISGFYLKEDAFELAELPYGNGAFGMVFLLPAAGVSPATVLENLNATVWENSLSKMYGTTVNIYLPRFKVEYKRTLNNDLQALGMTSMFGGDADFSLLSPYGSGVSTVLQKTFLDVYEEGTEGAAATAIILVGSSGESAPIPVIELNRPFIYFIKEKSTGNVFFAGIVQNL
ncbi:MAG: serpin family protein, partial [Tannerella sp.]|nr:serpin family protein [Tannerella sp.]